MEGKDIMHSQVVMRGDMAPINLGTYVIIKENVIVRPTWVKKHGQVQYIKMDIGDNVTIEPHCVISASSIGSNVHIGKNCVIGHRVVIKDNVKILDDTVIPPDTNIPPFTVFGGKPAQFLGEVSEAIATTNAELAKTYYRNFVGLSAQSGASNAPSQAQSSRSTA